jgi:hypothetical protein
LQICTSHIAYNHEQMSFGQHSFASPFTLPLTLLADLCCYPPWLLGIVQSPLPSLPADTVYNPSSAPHLFTPPITLHSIPHPITPSLIPSLYPSSRHPNPHSFTLSLTPSLQPSSLHSILILHSAPHPFTLSLIPSLHPFTPPLTPSLYD